jgi:uncharacterized Fe-S cluster protein YjdI
MLQRRQVMKECTIGRSHSGIFSLSQYNTIHMKKKYTKGGVTVVWNPDLCIHAGNCARGLGSVFNPKSRPWVNMDGGTSEQIIEQVGKCPSAALSILQEVTDEDSPVHSAIVQVLEDGPLRITAPCVITLADGTEEQREKDAFLCRCGHSAKKPFCDGSHKRQGFKG